MVRIQLGSGDRKSLGFFGAIGVVMALLKLKERSDEQCELFCND